MNYLYETPNKIYRISQQSDALWTEIFSVAGKPPICYNISCYDPVLAKWNREHPEARLADYVIVHSEEELENCFIWLKQHNIISRDEMEHWIREFSEISNVLPLTNSK